MDLDLIVFIDLMYFMDLMRLMDSMTSMARQKYRYDTYTFQGGMPVWSTMITHGLYNNTVAKGPKLSQRVTPNMAKQNQNKSSTIGQKHWF